MNSCNKLFIWGAGELSGYSCHAKQILTPKRGFPYFKTSCTWPPRSFYLMHIHQKMNHGKFAGSHLIPFRIQHNLLHHFASIIQDYNIKKKKICISSISRLCRSRPRFLLIMRSFSRHCDFNDLLPSPSTKVATCTLWPQRLRAAAPMRAQTRRVFLRHVPDRVPPLETHLLPAANGCLLPVTADPAANGCRQRPPARR